MSQRIEPISAWVLVDNETNSFYFEAEDAFSDDISEATIYTHDLRQDIAAQEGERWVKVTLTFEEVPVDQGS